MPANATLPTTARAHAASSAPDFGRLRRTEYTRLDRDRHAYLDFTGAALYAASQIDAQHRRLLRDVLGNPHSENPASARSTAGMERARARVLGFFGADPSEYDVVFTANATGALRIVGESFPFTRGSRFVLTADNHNSVNGIRCWARRARAEVRSVPLVGDLRSADPVSLLDGAAANRRHLFAFPAQSNFSGVRHPLAWVEAARARGYRVLLDAAAFVPTAPLSLTDVRPDFVCVSFYKMFGFPTGIGALVARHEALDELRRPWFAGGTVEWVSTQRAEHALARGAQAFEDGTAHFQAFDAVTDGLDVLNRIGMARIAAHTGAMTRLLLERLAALRYANGAPVVALHGPADLSARGATVAFTVLDSGGRAIPFDRVVATAAKYRVSVRGGCFCNPGCAEAAFAFPSDRSRECRTMLAGDFSIERFAECLGGPVGAVRASVGIPTIQADIDRLIDAVGYVVR